MKKEHKQPVESSFATGLFLGAAIGVGIGLLIAPRPGDQTLAILLDRTQGLGDRLASLADEARDVARVLALRIQQAQTAQSNGNRPPTEPVTTG